MRRSSKDEKTWSNLEKAVDEEVIEWLDRNQRQLDELLALWLRLMEERR